MPDSPDKALREVEDGLAEADKRAKALDKAIKEAEAKHPPPIDHADDCGVF